MLLHHVQCTLHNCFKTVIYIEYSWGTNGAICVALHINEYSSTMDQSALHNMDQSAKTKLMFKDKIQLWV